MIDDLSRLESGRVLGQLLASQRSITVAMTNSGVIEILDKRNICDEP